MQEQTPPDTYVEGKGVIEEVFIYPGENYKECDFELELTTEEEYRMELREQ